MKLEEARAIAEELKGRLQGVCHRIETVGDIRRQKPRVGKIKLLCIQIEGWPIPPEDYNWFSNLRPIPEFENHDTVDTEVEMLMVDKVLESRPKERWVPGAKKKMLLHIPSGIAVDILSTNERCWAVALVVATGGAKSNRCIAAAAWEKGWRFQASGDGFDTPDGHITCSTEQEVFEAVGLSYLPPEQRE